MSFVVGILTCFLVAICFLLILLVLVQLPKKDAGAGMAFGGGTADALFGSGSGNVLTKITKYTAIAFLGLSLFLGYLQSKVTASGNGSEFTKLVEQKQQQTPIVQQPPQTKPQATTPTANPANNLLSTMIPAVPTNHPTPAATGTNTTK